RSVDPPLLRSQAYIDGAGLDGDARFDIVNPADNRVVGSVPNLGQAETEQAIEAASAAFPAWSARTGKERANLMRKWFDLITANTEDLARVMTAEQGKPLIESRG